MLSITIHHHKHKFRPTPAYAFVAFVLLCYLACFNDSLITSGFAYDQAEKRLAHQIDQLINQAKKREGIISTQRSTDAEFMRRISLDLTGKIPPVAELRLFLADQDPLKREKLIDRLLASPGFVVHFTNIWRAILIPETSTDLQTRGQIPEFDAWMRSQLLNNTGYDEIVRNIIDVPLDINRGGERSEISQVLTPRAYYLSKQLKPENLAAGTSRAFLGVRIECAQCHDHPFDSWKQHQFWQYAAFFSNLDQSQPGTPGNALLVREVTGKPRIKIPDTNRLVEAIFLDGIQPEWVNEQTRPRRRLSQWITSAQNPYFAKATTNRIWSLFFGRGIIDPVDDFSSTNRASHPKLLELLAIQFREHDYDLKYLIREITTSQTYQLSSRQTDSSQSQVEWYGKMPTRGLTAEQIFANLVQATGFFQQTTDDTVLLRPGTNSPQAEIYELFKSESENRLDPKATILQALSLMNGTFITNATSLEQSDVFTAIVDFPELNDEQKIEAFFLSALSRYPTKDEINRLKTVIASAGSGENQIHAYSDLFWALLNSSEFLLNH
ncbi:MAG: DUF1549 and DUF1553 domain-containing protein [Planctomycetes bacterium]|nr:DUF1549 and DUF1553 domain-containing protein [Planctomycetota bacterium]MCH9726356.1 DUF1549 and DUF1553 domain-containing protein [Planctomycetota bacterium]MCH9776357.1 DUF1549 and DUF1553 domain-containing protein [Planctomycetota bacterium]MCH9793295.1 DUF1549 and DUF1553 domain-containing protein [Planctomycetota bacterium]